MMTFFINTHCSKKSKSYLYPQFFLPEHAVLPVPSVVYPSGQEVQEVDCRLLLYVPLGQTVQRP